MNCWQLDSDDTSVVFTDRAGRLCLDYIGARLQSSNDANQVAQANEPVVPHGALDRALLPSALPSEEGFPGEHPALVLRRNDKQLTFALRIAEARTASNLAFDLTDPDNTVRVTLHVVAEAGGNFGFRTTLSNTGTEVFAVDRLASGHIPLPQVLNEVRHFPGFWANEFQLEVLPLNRCHYGFGSDAGRSSHQSAAAVIACENTVREGSGMGLLAMLQWPGDHYLALSPCPSGGHILQAGCALTPGELTLAPGASFETPSLLIAFTELGLNGLRSRVARYWKAEATDSSGPRIHFNSWEGCYFDHDEARTLALISQAANLGAERFVLDDGWMKDRTGPGVGLGDWQPCPQRYPNGLGPVAAAARQAGMDFGLWVEPEMVTLDSELARTHPDWLIGDTGPETVSGRGQYLLDITRPEVMAYVESVLDRLVEDTHASYLKWDMNRDYAQSHLASLPGSLAMTQGFVTLVENFRARHSNVCLELCGAGGARSDPGTALLADRLWPTDSLDPIQRLGVQRQASLLLPHHRLGWHIGSATAETSGITQPLWTRVLMPLMAHMGIELNPMELDAPAKEAIRTAVRYFVDARRWLGEAKFYLLDDRAGEALGALLFSEQHQQGWLFFVQDGYPKTGTPTRRTLQGLDSGTQYRLKLLNPWDSAYAQCLPAWLENEGGMFSGDTLSKAGIRPPPLRPGHMALIDIYVEP